MKTFTLSSLLFLIVCTLGHAQVYTRTESWRTFEEFTSNGWVNVDSRTTFNLTVPSELNLRLGNLNAEITSPGVWGISPSNGTGVDVTFQLNLRDRHEYCGIQTAIVTFTYYAEGLSTSTFYPCTRISTGLCPITPSTGVAWQTMTETMNLALNTANRYLSFTITVGASGIFFFDEVKINYVVSYDTDCPHSCFRDCEFQGLDCHNYYSCIDYKYKEYFQCPQELSLAYNPELKSCDFIENVAGCDPNSRIPPDDCKCEYKSHESDCSKYYFCENSCNTTSCKELQCPAGLLWSVGTKEDGTKVQQCTVGYEAQCEPGKDPREQFSCRGKQDGLYTNEENCHAFWACEGEQTSVYFCPRNFIYNPEIKACDVASNAAKFCVNL